MAAWTEAALSTDVLWVLARLRSDDDACECGRCDDARDAVLELTLLSTPRDDDGDSCLKQRDDPLQAFTPTCTCTYTYTVY